MKLFEHGASGMPLTRRAFLSLSGATLLAAALPVEGLDAPLPEAVTGRALRAATVRSAPDAAAPVVRRLWPDSTTPLLGREGDWYAVPEGYVHRYDIQPMLSFAPEEVARPAALPAWATVVAAVAPVRRWASAAAPLVTRVGHGGVLAVVDALPGDHGGWYAVSERPELAPLGWTPAARWGICAEPEPARTTQARRLLLDRARAAIVAREDGRDVLRLPAAVPPGMQAGRTGIDGGLLRQPSARIGPWYGAAWVLSGSGVLLYGAYWHHRLGEAGEGPGWEVAPWAARWLYSWLPADAPIEVI